MLDLGCHAEETNMCVVLQCRKNKHVNSFPIYFSSIFIQDLEGGGGGSWFRIPAPFFMKIPHPTFFSYCYPASRVQFWRIPLPGSSQIPNPAPFFNQILDPVNTISDPACSRKYNKNVTQSDVCYPKCISLSRSTEKKIKIYKECRHSVPLLTKNLDLDTTEWASSSLSNLTD